MPYLPLLNSAMEGTLDHKPKDTLEWSLNMNDLNDDWLSWPPESMDRFFTDNVPDEPHECISNCPEVTHVIKPPVFF